MQQSWQAKPCSCTESGWRLHPLLFRVFLEGSLVYQHLSQLVYHILWYDIRALLHQEKCCCKSLTSLSVSLSTHVFGDYCSGEPPGSSLLHLASALFTQHEKNPIVKLYTSHVWRRLLKHTRYSYFGGRVLSLNPAFSPVSIEILSKSFPVYM